MKLIRGNTIGTPIKPEKNLVKATALTEEEKAQARANIGAAAVGEGGSVDLSNYYTKDEVDQKGYLTEAQLDGKGYLTESQLEGKCYQTKAEVQALINTAIDNIPVWDGSFTKGVL